MALALHATPPYIPPMQSFAALLERLVLTPSRNAKLQLIIDYLRHTPDPSRGWAIAAITGDLSIPSVKPAAIRELVAGRVGPVLFQQTAVQEVQDVDEEQRVEDVAAIRLRTITRQMPLAASHHRRVGASSARLRAHQCVSRSRPAL